MMWIEVDLAGIMRAVPGRMLRGRIQRVSAGTSDRAAPDYDKCQAYIADVHSAFRSGS